ncbi:MAG: molecular chaperone DnaJ [Candidatus Brocadiia bacterium]|nr:molecular chaperone DnaJ [Candidatus Brocadiia bacterium]
MSPRDYYEVLGVGREAEPDMIKRAYRKLALKYHPDRNPDDPDAAGRFKEAAQAYDVLGDDEKRRVYDVYGEAGLAGRGRGPRDFGSFDDVFSAFSDIFSGNIFDEFFAATGRGHAERGRSLRVALAVSFEEVAGGVTKVVTLRRHEHCEKCRGTGCKPGTQPATCSYCRGYGQVESRRGFFAMRTTCPRCQGTGTIITDPCPACRGAGLVEKPVDVDIPIPAGVESGTRIRIRGEGERGPSGGRGDLYCDILVREHELFRRNGTDLICELPITYPTAALGGEVEVPTLGGGTEMIEVPRGTQSGDMLRLRSRGLPALRSSARGDLLVEISVEVPDVLSPRHEELLRELAEVEGASVSARRKSFLDRIKNYVYSMTRPEGEEGGSQ